jgi:hypothetical protein
VPEGRNLFSRWTNRWAPVQRLLLLLATALVLVAFARAAWLEATPHNRWLRYQQWELMKDVAPSKEYVRLNASRNSDLQHYDMLGTDIIYSRSCQDRIPHPPNMWREIPDDRCTKASYQPRVYTGQWQSRWTFSFSVIQKDTVERLMFAAFVSALLCMAFYGPLYLRLKCWVLQGSHVQEPTKE